MMEISSGRDMEELPFDAELSQNLDYELDSQEDDVFTWMQEQVESTNDPWINTDHDLPTAPLELCGPQASAPNIIGEPSTTTPMSQNPTSSGPPKHRRRFCVRVGKMLRNWFAAHQQHPYATTEDLDMLQDHTGLSRQQVINWLVNARRRSKPSASLVQASYSRNAAQSTFSGPGAIDIPHRPPTPMACAGMSPLQRWQHSPPECEPVSVASISRAVAASAGIGSFSPMSGRSSDNASSVSSAGNSHSSCGSGSHLSAHSYSSDSSPAYLAQCVGRRRRRRAPKRKEYLQPSLSQTCYTYQCTFCPETFKTKHNWTRHEKSLHLSLERWVCSPHGATAVHPEQGVSCIYCGQAEPSETHLNTHNYASCVERSLEERTFYRKDHLQQHLKLLHGAKYLEWPMDSWKTDDAQIKSRCGFCGDALSSWAIRVDHLADHFKRRSTMADWKGDWGFDDDVNNIIENALPPYLIHHEQTSPLPFSVVQGPAGTPASAYELIKLELECYMYGYLDAHGRFPSDHELQCEGCSVIFGAEVASDHSVPPAASWLRDVFTSSAEIVHQAGLRPMEQMAKSRMSQLKINGKHNIFEGCELESQLCRVVALQNMMGQPMTDIELQQEAANLLDRVDPDSPNSPQPLTEFLIRLVWMSNTWLGPLRDRGRRSPSLNLADGDESRPDLPTIVHSHHQPSPELAAGQLQEGSASLYQPLVCFETLQSERTTDISPFPLSRPTHGMSIDNASTTHRAAALSTTQTTLHSNTPSSWTLFNNDANSYRRLTRGLSRFVMTTMSSNNPTCHVPTDEELEYQARWIWYGDDDPWNQTPADNAEWLREFKRDCGLVNDDGIA